MEQTQKTCSWCKQVKPITEFYVKTGRTKDGHTGYCKACSVDPERRARFTHSGRKGNWEERETLRKTGQKRCGWCDKILPFSEFYQDNRKLDGCYPYCKRCHTAAVNGEYILSRKDRCESCGFIPLDPCQLEVDHKDGNRENSNPDNWWTLCVNCHKLKTFRPHVFWPNHMKRQPIA